jgi:hypothetical protein
MEVSDASAKVTVRSRVTGEEMTTTDLGQALIDGRFDHVGKIKGPILGGLSAPRFVFSHCWFV